VVAVDDEFPLGEVGEFVGFEEPPADAFEDAPDAVGSGAEVGSGPLVVAAVATEEESDSDKTARVAAAPLPVEVRTAGRRDPTLLLETQVPATVLLIS